MEQRKDVQRKDVIRPDGRRIPAAENDILVLLEKEQLSKKDTKDLWNNLQSNKLKSMGDEKGLIGFLQHNHISRMWEIAACKYEHIEVLMAPKDADAHVNDVLSGKWIVKTAEITRGLCSFLFARARTTEEEEFPFKDNFEMTISGPVNPNVNRNDVALNIERTSGDNPNYYPVVVKDKPFKLFVQRNPTSVSGSMEHCVAAFTFANGNNDTHKIIVYIRFAGPTMLVGKAFKANSATNSEDKDLWGHLVFAKH